MKSPEMAPWGHSWDEAWAKRLRLPTHRLEHVCRSKTVLDSESTRVAHM